jgi:hypothetical protein
MGKHLFPQWVIYALDVFGILPWFGVAQFDNLEINSPPKK